MNHELPTGWVEVEIGEIATVVGGGTPKANEPDNFLEPGKGTAWLTPADLSGYKQKEIGHGKRDLSEKGLNSSSAVLMPKGALLFSSRAPIGYVAIASNEISTNQGFKSFVFADGVYPSYAFYYLKSIKSLAEERGSGSTFKELSGAAAKKLPFILPPTSEQIGIADKLDRILARVNAAQARLDKIPALIKRFRQSVLTAATSGELTQEWRDLNVKEGCSTTVLLGDISEVSTGVTPLKSNRSYYENGRIPWLTSSVTGDFYVRKSEKFITSKAVDECRLKLYPPGTLLMAMYGEGKTRGQVTEIKISATVNQACAAIQIISDSVSKEYVRLCLDDNYERTRMMAEGGAQPNLNLKKVRSIPINLPELDEQHEIVRRVESLFALADSVEKQYQDAKARSDRLTQAILAKAFRGELVPQNPDDEPAEALLQRIQQQRAEQATAGKRGKARKVSG